MKKLKCEPQITDLADHCLLVCGRSVLLMESNVKMETISCRRTWYDMALKVLLNVLLVSVSGVGFLFAFVAAGRLMNFLSYIPTAKVDMSETHSKWNICDDCDCGMGL